MAQNDFLEGVRKGMMAYMQTRDMMQRYQGNQLQMEGQRLQMETERMKQDAYKRSMNAPDTPTKEHTEKQPKWDETPEGYERKRRIDEKVRAEFRPKPAPKNTTPEPKDTRPKLLRQLNLTQEQWDAMPQQEREATVFKYTNGKGKLTTDKYGEPVIESTEKKSGSTFRITLDKNYDAKTLFKKYMIGAGMTDEKMQNEFIASIGEPGYQEMVATVAGGDPDELLDVQGFITAYTTLKSVYVPPEYRQRVGNAIRSWFASGGTQPLFPSLPPVKSIAEMQEQLRKTFGTPKTGE